MGQLIGANANLDDALLKFREFPIRFHIVGNATPASKTQRIIGFGSEIGAISSEGKTADATAIEASVGFTTEVDATNARVGFLLKGSELGGSSGIARVHKVEIATDIAGTGGASLAVAKVDSGTTVDGLTAGGNIAFELSASSGLDLASETMDIEVLVRYSVK